MLEEFYSSPASAFLAESAKVREAIERRARDSGDHRSSLTLFYSWFTGEFIRRFGNSLDPTINLVKSSGNLGSNLESSSSNSMSLKVENPAFFKEPLQANETLSSTRKRSVSDDYESLLDDDFSGVLMDVNPIPVPAKILKKDESDQTVTTTSTAQREPSPIAGPSREVPVNMVNQNSKQIQQIRPCPLNKATDQKVFTLVKDIAQLTEELKKKLILKGKTSTFSSEAQQKELYRLDARFVYKEGEEPYFETFLNMGSLQRNCVRLFCPRESCPYSEAYGLFQRQLNRQISFKTVNENRNHPRRPQPLQCPNCHLGVLKPSFQLTLLIEDLGPKKEQISAIIGSPISNLLFSTSPESLLYEDPRDTKLSEAVTGWLEELANKRKLSFVLEPVLVSSCPSELNPALLNLGEDHAGDFTQVIFHVRKIYSL